MAPLSLSIVPLLREVRLYIRDLDASSVQTSSPTLQPWTPILSRNQGNILQILAVTFSAVSVASAVLAFYWFIRMRRSFRHDLIMLLIQSDMFKALWFMLYPIVVFTKGEIPNDSTFCQVNGFFIALGVEASDFAVLMIALHTALYIFNPRSSTCEGGLYPYRRIAYVLWVIFPLLMASLAFVNDRHGYVSDGTYCYIPVQPFWYRLALSWIPRYIIFIIILTIYASIYFYVRYKFRNFNKDIRVIVHDSVPRRRPTVPPEPPLNRHGLIGTPPSSAADSEQRKPSVSTIDEFTLDAKPPASPLKFFLKKLPAKIIPQPISPEHAEISGDTDSFEGPSTPRPLPAYIIQNSDSAALDMQDSLANPSLPTRLTSWQDPFVNRFSPQPTHPATISRNPSVVHIRDILRHHQEHHHQPYPSRTRTPSPCTSISPPFSHIQLFNSRGENLALTELIQTREKIRRQLRFLFIYPLVYIGMWVIPFVSHILQFDDRLARQEPFVLVAITTVCMCMQAAVDCWLFSTRERPWRFMDGNEGGGFWGSLFFWAGWKDRTGSDDERKEGNAKVGSSARKGMGKGKGAWKGPGRTKEEMIREARAAYQRRDEELAERRGEMRVGGHVDLEVLGRRRGERSWWEDGDWGSDGVCERDLDGGKEDMDGQGEGGMRSEKMEENLEGGCERVKD